MDFYEAVRTRRSIRSYTEKPVPKEAIDRALSAALLAPNSSNLQTWGFYWVKTPEKKKKLVEACLSQRAARTAQELIVVTAEPKRWKQNRARMIEELDRAQAPKFMYPYYQKLIPFTYGFQFLAPLKWLILNGVGLFRPMTRRPWSFRDREEISIKSAALACENFMLAIAAEGFGTCPMEGFDECRVKGLLGLGFSDRVVMVISVGEPEASNGIWGAQIRFDSKNFIQEC
ncbi:MAG: nitroreductase family protein [Bdellovibrionales bacterium]|nr:nitroreductase family protein [Bdellovibrionales bacterium]